MHMSILLLFVSFDPLVVIWSRFFCKLVDVDVVFCKMLLVKKIKNVGSCCIFFAFYDHCLLTHIVHFRQCCRIASALIQFRGHQRPPWYYWLESTLQELGVTTVRPLATWHALTVPGTLWVVLGTVCQNLGRIFFSLDNWLG